MKKTIFMIFGGGGDLTRRKLIPALHNLFLDEILPEDIAIIGIDQDHYTDTTWRRYLHEAVNQFSRRRPVSDPEWEKFAKYLSFEQADFTQIQCYAALQKKLTAIEKEWGEKADHIFYLATPPAFFGTIAELIGQAGLSTDEKRDRIVVEKPIGYNLLSATQLNAALRNSFKEDQIYRIDHYLAKETVQNILAFRFANPMFEPIWNRRYIEYVTITVAEEGGVDNRGRYYDRAGALRDMVQNHMLQLLCAIAMEPPVSFVAEEIRNKKMDVLNAIRPLLAKEVYLYATRGQYDAGWISGKPVVAYREEPGVNPQSDTETYMAIKFFVDNWRWQDVPFYLRTGKRLPKQISEISIFFRAVPHKSFPTEATLDWQPARLVICIQPEEGIILKFRAKQPGPKFYLKPVDMRFNYQEMFQTQSVEAYETLLSDLIRADSTLFMRADQVEAAWKLLMPILEVWENTPPSNFPNYKAGTWGPESADTLLAHDGYTWLQPASMKNFKGY